MFSQSVPIVMSEVSGYVHDLGARLMGVASMLGEVSGCVVPYLGAWWLVSLA